MQDSARGNDDHGAVADGGDDRRVPVGPVDIRRAVLAILLTCGGPMSVADVIVALRERHGATAGPKRVSDVLRHQVRIGRVRRVRRGVYEAVPDAFPKSTAWRCVNWELERARRDASLGSR